MRCALVLALWTTNGFAAAAEGSPAKERTPAYYRGRTEPRAASVALEWIPRVIFYPVYFISEYAVRRPIYAVAGWIDRHHVVPTIDKVFNPTPNIHWVPTLSIDTGADTFVGARGDWRNLLVSGHDASGSVATGGIKAWQLQVKDRWQVSDHIRLGVRGDFESRADRTFYGFGPRSLVSSGVHFGLVKTNALTFASFEYRNHFRLEVAEGLRRIVTDLDTSSRSSRVPQILPQHAEFTLAVASIDLALDSRATHEQINGVRLTGNVTYARDTGEHSFASTEGDLEGAFEISRPDRVLVARVYAKDTHPIANRKIPFMNLATLGGENHYGFNWGRFRGESALMAEVRYRNPIAYDFDAQWTLSVGNVFSRHFQDFSPAALTGSLGFGLRTRRASFGPFELMFAVGTSTFDDRFKVENFRVYLGTAERL